jgi:DNA-binding NarL/FixJ family response regulator
MLGPTSLSRSADGAPGLLAPAANVRRPSLMIADDDRLIRLLLSAELADQFDVVGAADDADAAIELASASQPDLAIVDVEMPKGGGSRAVQGILEVSSQTAIVILSGDESGATVREMIRDGAVACCPKGTDPQEFAVLLMDSLA